MNNKSKELGLKNTNFVTPNGLDDENHFTTAYDLAILADYALKNDFFKEIVSTKNYTVTINSISKAISNTNELLGNLDGVYGVKTGFTFNAGRCLVTACKRGELDIITVVLGANTKKIRTKDSYNIINYIYNNFYYIDISDCIETSFEKYMSYTLNNLSFEKTCTTPIFELEKLSNYKFPTNYNEKLNLKTKMYINNYYSIQTQKGSSIGFLYVYNNDKLLCKVNIYLKNSLKPNTWHYYFKYIFKNLF